MLADLIESTALMRLEDEGIDPRKHDYDLWHQTIEVLIAQRRIWIATDQGQLAFVIEIGTRCSKGTTIGSTYVPTKFRGQGIATRGCGLSSTTFCKTRNLSVFWSTKGIHPPANVMKRWGLTMVLSINSSDSPSK